IADLHKGMGHFLLTPNAGSRYTANLTFDNGETQSYPLPEVADQGISVTVQKSDTAQLQLVLRSNESFLEANRGKPFYLIAQTNGVLCYAAQATLRSDAVVVNLPKE